MSVILLKSGGDGMDRGVLLVAHVCSRRYIVCSPKKFAVVFGFNHKSIGLRVVGFAGHLKRCTELCDA